MRRTLGNSVVAGKRKCNIKMSDNGGTEKWWEGLELFLQVDGKRKLLPLFIQQCGQKSSQIEYALDAQWPIEKREWAKIRLAPLHTYKGAVRHESLRLARSHIHDGHAATAERRIDQLWVRDPSAVERPRPEAGIDYVLEADAVALDPLPEVVLCQGVHW